MGVTMITPNPIDKQRIALKLDTFQLVLDSNIELLEKDPLLKEQLNLKMQVAQHYLQEVDVCEKAGDQINYDCALDSAALLLADVHDLIHHLLDE
jgi:hypothetical protein